jgi:hypothetical protein
MLSCTIDAHEGCNVATADIPGAFLQTDMEGNVHMMLVGKTAELLVRLDPKMYRKHIMIKKGKPIMYVQLKKALYGTLQASLPFWKDLSKHLKEWGFEINPYDWCVANKTIKGKQCTVLWHVGDIKVSHEDPEVVTQVLEMFEGVYGSKDAPIKITRGKVHDYLGMAIDYRVKGKVRITLVDSIQAMLDTIPDDMGGVAATPVANHLFDVNEDGEKLDEETAQVFHHFVAKLLFLCKRVRPDIQTSVAFLCTRVKVPDCDNYKKLGRTMKYLRWTIGLPLILEADNLHIIKWWVDASYAVHPGMARHTGGMMTLGKGATYGTSTRQKINTKSSTEAELVGVNDVMPQVLWTKYWMEAQGYNIDENTIGRDNQLLMLLKNNGRASSSKRTRHINIHYFFITKNHIKAGEVKVEYCPTGEMIADYFTKPLQGYLFKMFCDMIMNNYGDLFPTKGGADRRSVLNELRFARNCGR